MKYAICKGNPVDGFTFIGPFDDRAEAVYYGDSVDPDWWIVELEVPEEN